eukprot:363767-Chlamydomonas_euryale.AAC.10
MTCKASCKDLRQRSQQGRCLRQRPQAEVAASGKGRCLRQRPQAKTGPLVARRSTACPHATPLHSI